MADDPIDWNKYQDPGTGRFLPGNPGGPGRPKGAFSMRTKIEKALSRVDENGKSVLDQLAEAWIEEALFKRNSTLLIALADRLYPKTSQVEISGGETPLAIDAVDLRRLSPEQLKNLRDIARDAIQGGNEDE
jgi:hypothetical protein